MNSVIPLTKKVVIKIDVKPKKWFDGEAAQKKRKEYCIQKLVK